VFHQPEGRSLRRRLGMLPESEPHVLHTRPDGRCVSINVYREKEVVAGARNQHYLQLWRPAA
jgi:hypothetical protein